MRARRHGTQKSSAASGGAAAATARKRYFHSMPARMSIMAVTPATTRAVPRSGCLTISSINTTGIMAARSRVLRQSRIWSSRVERNQARKRMMTGLAISEGWKENAAEADPAMGVMRVAKEEDHDEQQGGNGKRRIDKARGVVAGVVHPRQNDHGEDAHDGP